MSTDDERMQEAYELGCSDGWSHANFVDAYGSEHDRRGPDYPSHMLDIAPQSTQWYGMPKDDRQTEAVLRPRLRGEFKRGWSDGRKRFHRGQYPDGTKIED